METLNLYGWSDFTRNRSLNPSQPDLKLGRVISLTGLTYHLVTETNVIPAELSGKLLYGTEPELIPQTGDWVYYMDYGENGYIIELIERRNALWRRQPGNVTGRQVMAANVDYGLIVQGLDMDFNVMRLDRYIVQLTDCGIQPIIVLNKVDLIENREQYISELSRHGIRCSVYFCSTIVKTGMDELFNNALIPGKTHILIGSSGVGKSSLLNALTGDGGLRTDTVSKSTGKGKHTTTARHLFVLSNGSLVIDTPGMREFGIALEGDVTSKGLFPTIDELAVNCRFADCTHLTEAGCAVLQALQNGNLDAKVYASYEKLIKEQRRFEISKEDQKRLGKQFGKMIREARDYRSKYKY